MNKGFLKNGNRRTGVTRREVLRNLLGGAAYVGSMGAPSFGRAVEQTRTWRLQYIVASCMYGTMDVEAIVPEVRKTGAETIDLWPRPHGNQREQLSEMGHDAFRRLLQNNDVRLGILTHYDLGPFRLQPEFEVGRKLGVKMVVTGSRGKKGLRGSELKAEVSRFVEAMKPHVEAAEEAGMTIAIENHGNALIDSPDSLRYFGELSRSPNLGVALAPYHLPQDPSLIAGLIRDLGPKLVHFYAWEHGKGAMKKRPKEEEMQQLPGFGSLDFKPIVGALKAVNYRGWTSIFMHPVPRGVPILPSVREVTEAINRSRKYLERCADSE